MQEISENAWDDEQASGYNLILHSIGPLTHDPVTNLALGWSMVKLEQNWSQVQKISEYAQVTQKALTHSNIWLRYRTPPYTIKQRGCLRADHVKNRPFNVKFWSIRPMYNPVTSWASKLGQLIQKIGDNAGGEGDCSQLCSVGPFWQVNESCLPAIEELSKQW